MPASIRGGPIRWPNGCPIRWPNGGPRDPVRALLRGCWQVQQRPAPSVPSHPVAGLLRGCWQLQQCPAPSVQVAVAVRRRGGPVATLRSCWQLQRPAPSVSFGSIQTSFGTKRQHPAEAAEVRFLRGARSEHPEARVQHLQKELGKDMKEKQHPVQASVHRVEPRVHQLQRFRGRGRVNCVTRCRGSVFA